MTKRPEPDSGRRYLQIRMSPELRAWLQEGADACEQEVSAWARLRLLEAADVDIKLGKRKGRWKRKAKKP